MSTVAQHTPLGAAALTAAGAAIGSHAGGGEGETGMDVVDVGADEAAQVMRAEELPESEGMNRVNRMASMPPADVSLATLTGLMELTGVEEV
jgi:hypothetical protein